MLHTKFQGHRPLGSGEEGFYHIWAWRPSWSCDQDCFNKFLFPHPSEEKMLKECGRWTDDGRTDDGWTTYAYLSYKLTNEPLAQVS